MKVRAVRVRPMIYVALSVAALMVAAAPATHAQTPVKTIFEKYRLLGTFAVDCGKPASPDNLFYWNRALDDGAIERDQMSGPAKRDWIVFLDNATELRPNEIAVSGTRDGKPINGVWRVEDRRMLQVEVNWDGKEYVGNGRLLQNGSSMPWLNKCDSK